MFTKLCPQNEKEEALTTNVWIEMVTFGGPFFGFFQKYPVYAFEKKSNLQCFCV